MKYFVSLLLLVPLAAAAQSQAAAQSVAECETIKNDLAYNQCLASFGPKRGERASRSAGTDAEEVAGQAASGSQRGGRAVRRGRGGRQVATFDVVGGRQSAVSAGAKNSRKGRGSRRRR
jgi:hypothetical protein